MTLQDLIDFHTTGAAACEAFAVTPAAGDAKYKDITKHYTKRAKWHHDAVALLSAPVAVVMPERMVDTWSGNRDYMTYDKGWNDALGAVAILNGAKP